MNEEYDLPDDVYNTKGLFDDGQEGKQDNEGLLYWPPWYWPSSLMKTEEETFDFFNSAKLCTYL